MRLCPFAEPQIQFFAVCSLKFRYPHNIVRKEDTFSYARGNDRNMILVTRLNGTPIMLNENFIEAAEETPDTVVTMMNGHRYILREKLDEIIEKSYEFHRKLKE